jgi:hypothetical protein
MHRSLIVVDDFYNDPHEIRRIALGFDYPVPDQPKHYPGRNSRERLAPDGLDQVLSQVVGERIRGLVDERSPHGRFRITLAGEAGRYAVHVDPTGLHWVGVIYLSLPQHCRGGTAFFRHKGLGLDRTPRTVEQLKPFGAGSVDEFLAKEGPREESWEHLMTVPMRFNRMIMYRPWAWHSAGESFGDSLENGRLIQVLACVPG